MHLIYINPHSPDNPHTFILKINFTLFRLLFTSLSLFINHTPTQPFIPTSDNQNHRSGWSFLSRRLRQCCSHQQWCGEAFSRANDVASAVASSRVNDTTTATSSAWQRSLLSPTSSLFLQAATMRRSFSLGRQCYYCYKRRNIADFVVGVLICKQCQSVDLHFNLWNLLLAFLIQFTVGNL